MMQPARSRPLVLVILDGFGLRAESQDNAILLANMPHWKRLVARYPHTELGTSGPDVGLPPGQMGNSEVGHLNLGAGRIAQMDISRIDCAVADGTLGQNEEISGLLYAAKTTGGRLHLLGLVSNGGVHSSLEHLLALIDVAAKAQVPVVVHAFLDGRDTPPQSAGPFLQTLSAHLINKGIIGTIAGRYWAMDRDNRWDRIARAYQAIVSAQAPVVPSAQAGLEASYAAGKQDEFVEPIVVQEYGGIDVGKDVALFFNFRPDRARELSAALTQESFNEFARPVVAPFARYVCMTNYDRKLALPVAFPKLAFTDTFPEMLSRQGLTQFRCAETEKFAHVTYFFNGGREEPFTGEERVLVPSPRDVDTYDQKPEMSSADVTTAVVQAIKTGKFDFILVNFANPDMVGHTGVLSAAIRAVESIDPSLGAITDAALTQGGVVLITADHGNCELMRDPVTGAPHTSHTLLPVPFVLVDDSRREIRLRPHGRLCDVAPTMLDLLQLAAPSAMTGHSLLAADG